jgi:nitrate/nitrite-specific signal transduction histidine kinase
MGYAAFYIFIQLGQIDRIASTITSNHSEEQIGVLKDRMNRTTHQLRNEMIGIAILGTLISIIGMGYTINMVIRPLRKLVDYAEKKGKSDLPEFKSNHEIKQLATQLADLLGDSSTEQNAGNTHTKAE